MHLQESGENYLETILVLENRTGSAVRSIDIASELSVSKPSVSRAMSILRADGLINMEKGGAITLTERGRELASGVWEKHVVLTNFLNKGLNVTRETAEKDACRIEHILSPETFEKIKAYYKEHFSNL